jgi:hypothetical protein
LPQRLRSYVQLRPELNEGQYDCEKQIDPLVETGGTGRRDQRRINKREIKWHPN